MQAAHFGFPIAEVPARCRYFEDASSVGFKAGAVYGAKTLWAGVRLVLHRRGILRVAQVQPRGRSSTTVNPPSAGRDGRQLVARVDPLRAPTAAAGRARPGGRRAGRATGRARSAASTSGAGRVHEHAVAGPQRVDARARAPAARRSATKLASHGSPSEQPVDAAAAQQDLESRGRGRPSRGSRARPACGARARARRPAPRARAAADAQSRSSAPRSELPPGAAWASARAREALADRRPRDGDDERGDGERRSASPPVRVAARPSAPARSSRPSQSAPVSSAGQRDVDEDVVLRAVDVVAQQHDPVGRHARRARPAPARSRSHDRAAAARQLDERGGRGGVAGADRERRASSARRRR